MLHLIFQSVIEQAVLQRVGSGDDVVFIENAVFRVYKNNSLSAKLQNMLNDNIHLYVLIEEIETRGIDKQELIPGVKVIDYEGLVQLTENNKVIMTWN